MTNYQSKKIGRRTRKLYIGLVSYESFVPDHITYKTLQLRIGGWVKTNPDYNSEDYYRTISKTKFRVKNMIRMWAKTHGMFQESSIVDIDTSEVESGQSKRPYQYFKLDLVLYVKPNNEYDRDYVALISHNLSQRIIDVLKEFPETWTFVKSKKRKPRKTNGDSE